MNKRDTIQRQNERKTKHNSQRVNYEQSKSESEQMHNKCTRSQK